MKVLSGYITEDDIDMTGIIVQSTVQENVLGIMPMGA